MKVAVAMSGGVDSAVAAAILKKAGYDVTGMTMRITEKSREEIDAGAIASRLGIPHHIIDLRDIFKRKIIEYFCGEYGRGRTPNPCILCNRYIKFGVLGEEAKKRGAVMLATGHYARIEKNKNGRYILKKGCDKNKDQSYFLCQLTQEQLGHAIFPLGSLTRDEVRKMAAKLGLTTMNRPASQEICFIPDNDHTRFLREYTTQIDQPGPIRDEAGKMLGRHRGITSYTVGQRKGLGIAAAEPLYVTAIESERNTVVVGTKEQTYGTELIADNLNWITIDAPKHAIKVKAKIRHRHVEAEATVTPQDDGAVWVKFTEPQMAITPGQAVVFYEGDNVLGGGTIIKRGR